MHVELQSIALTCPHCRTLTHLTPVAVPKFEDLSRRRPRQIGIVFRCDACDEPIFLKFAAKSYTALRIELGQKPPPVRRATASARQKELDAREAALDEREAALEAREAALRGDTMSMPSPLGFADGLAALTRPDAG